MASDMQNGHMRTRAMALNEKLEEIKPEVQVTASNTSPELSNLYAEMISFLNEITEYLG